MLVLFALISGAIQRSACFVDCTLFYPCNLHHFTVQKQCNPFVDLAQCFKPILYLLPSPDKSPETNPPQCWPLAPLTLTLKTFKQQLQHLQGLSEFTILRS